VGERWDVDYEAMPAIRRYRASELRQKHPQRIERHRFSRVSELFGLSSTLTLYDLTHPYFEGKWRIIPRRSAAIARKSAATVRC
jgi:hypothetical protein